MYLKSFARTILFKNKENIILDNIKVYKNL